MRKLLTIVAGATIAATALGIAGTPAAAAPDPTRACKTYLNDTDRITKREHELEVLAAYQGQNVEEYCAANAG